MNPRAILFDLYGTLIDIETDEGRPIVWDTLARFLGYEGVLIESETLKNTFFARQEASLESRCEQHPELDVPGLFNALLRELNYTGDGQLAVHLTRLYRTMSIVRFDLFPDTMPAIQALRGAFKLGVISDAQRLYLEPEIEMCGLRGWLDTVVVSSDYGFRKPDPRLFRVALEQLGVLPSEAIYVGDNASRDVLGAHNAGLQAVLLRQTGDQSQLAATDKPEMRLRTLDDLCERLLHRRVLMRKGKNGR